VRAHAGELALEAGDVNAATETIRAIARGVHEAEDKLARQRRYGGRARRISPEERVDGLGASLRRAPRIPAFRNVCRNAWSASKTWPICCTFAACPKMMPRAFTPRSNDCVRGLPCRQRPRAEVRRKDRVATLRRALGDAAFDAAWAEGRTWGRKDDRCALSTTTSEPLRLERSIRPRFHTKASACAGAVAANQRRAHRTARNERTRLGKPARH